MLYQSEARCSNPSAGGQMTFSFFLTSRLTKQKQTKPGVLYFFLLLPPQGCKAPHLFFTPSPSGNKSKGRRAKPGVLKFLSLLYPRNDAGPLISFFSFSCTGNKSSGQAKPGCCSFPSSSSSPPASIQGPSSLFHPFPLGQQKQRQTSKAWVL